MENLTYSNVFLKPQKCIVNSRKECDTSVQFGPRKFVMPVVPANMKSVINEETCKYLARKGYFYVMHRFGISNLDFCKMMIKENVFMSISTGVNQDSYDDLQKLLDNNISPEYITIDIANAWCVKAEKMVQFIKNNFKDTFLIVGNVATSEAVKEIEQWGVSSIKAGLSVGKSCITKIKTGFYRSILNAIQDCSSVTELPIIADGGVQEHGDIAKAIIFGAKIVMAGYLFAGYDQSAGNIIELPDGRKYKEYFGSASKYNKTEAINVEGKKILVDYRGNMDNLLRELQEDLQSSISYGGVKNVYDLKGKEFYII